MIITQKTSWLQMVFAVQGTTLRRVSPRVFFMLAFAAIVTYVSLRLGKPAYSLTPVPFTIVGLALSIFLGFRNNAAYDRYWEGRKLWGSMVNTTRSFAIQILTVMDHDGDDRSELASFQQSLIRLILAYVNALRHRLRDSDPQSELTEYISDADVRDSLCRHQNLPVAIARQIAESLRIAHKSGWLDTLHVPLLHENLTQMVAVQGACERIKGTPIPFTYSVLTHRTVMLYCLALPFGLFETVGLMTPLVVGFVAFTFLGLDAVGDEIEQPFGVEDNQLPLHSITRTIEINLLQLVETDPAQLPTAIKPDGHVLL